jgi:hypothetical protein
MAFDDPRLDPDGAHALNGADCVRSQARLADIQLGLTSAGDGWFWRGKAQRRIAALEEDGGAFGLMPHEEAELEQLKAMLTNVNQRLATRGNA